MIKDIIQRVVDGENLSIDESRRVMSEIMEGKLTDSQIAAFLTALRMKGETDEEITGCAEAMKRKALHFPSDEILVDCVGTGGDKVGTFNISTTVAFVVAGAGIKVAKHGNRSVSSKCGSADVLEALGVNINLNYLEVQEVLKRTGICFLFAPTFHKAMKYAINPRREIGIRSIFNILGPLTNPLDVKFQLIGVYNPNLTEIVAQTIKNLGVKGAYVVHGADGLDEISITGETKITELKNDAIKTYTISPEDFNFKRRSLKEIKGGDKFLNSEITQKVLKGEQGAPRDIVLLNAAAVIASTGKANNLREGIEIARDSIDSGKAYKKLEELVRVSNTTLTVGENSDSR